MVVGAFPVAKLGALLIKQISKPIANAVKNRAKTHPVFRKYICMPPAQFYNWCEIQAKMWILNLGRPVNIPVLNEAMAIELGANLVGEGIIFVIAAGILISEYTRSSRKEAAKELDKEKEMVQLHQTIRDLYFTTEQQSTQIRELTRNLGNLETRVVLKPWYSKPDNAPEEPPETPPPSSPPSVVDTDTDSDNSLSLELSEDSDTDDVTPQIQNTLLKAIRIVETEFLQSPKKQPESREESVLTLALNHIYKDVYRLPMKL